MNAIERLDTYLGALRARLRAHIYVRGALFAAGVVLAVVVAFSWLLQRNGFDAAFALAGRLLLIAALLAIVVACVWLPLRVLRKEDGARVFERKLPEQQGRLSTYLDTRRGEHPTSPLVELLAEDAMQVASRTPVDEVVPPRRIQLNAVVAILALCAVGALLMLTPDHWRYASRHLLLGAELPREVVPIRKIVVHPGDVTVRRNSDLAIRASTEGFDPAQATIFVRFADQGEWERAPMQSDSPGTFGFKLYALRSPLTYYIDADGTRSAEHRVSLVDLPRIERVRLTYDYPDWTGLASEVDEASRDIRAVAGTQVTVEIESDAPLEHPVLIHDGRSETLAPKGAATAGTLAIEKPGTYHIAAMVAGEHVALSDEYAIEIVPDEKPVVQIERPGRDWRATNIEEVPVRVRAEDDFRLQSVELRYSINGGEWRSLPLDRGVKESRAKTLLELEKLGEQSQALSGSPLLSPGDLVSYYAVAKDHKRSVKTDLFMVQVQPFERRFSQQNGGGGGGGLADEQGAISERQREILLATWNLQRADATNRRSREQLEDNAKMLSDMQTTLAQQARTLATRTRARAQVEADERVRNFVESLERAATAMDPAAAHLSAFELEKAVPIEQQALQQLLRAEAAFREVQVSMQNDGGGQGAQAARDFGEMFELEMDVEKSQYESESQLSEANTSQEMEEALRKLKELAERQEQLAEEANRNPQLTPEQRWRQEQLRREVEDLRRQLAAMNRQQQSQGNRQSEQQSQSGESSGQQSEQQQASNQGASQGSSQGATRGARQQDGSQSALESVDEALSRMQAANDERRPTGEDPATSAREASRNLREAVRQLDRPTSGGLDQSLEQLADRAGNLASEQRRIESDLYDALRESGQAGPMSPRRSSIDDARAQALVEGKQQLAEQLGELQKDLRDSVHRYRGDDKEAKRQLAEIVNDVEASDLMYRMRRSAAEIYYGRARDAAAREGIITESLQNLETDLREASARASQSRSKSAGEEPATERLLTEVAELRRRVDRNERLQAVSGTQSPSESSQASEQGASPSSERGSQQAQAQISGDKGQSDGQTALSAWDPVSPNARMPEGTLEGRDSLARQSTSIAERARRLRERAGNRELTAQELASLRELARELRQLAGNPLAAEAAAMKGAVAQIELTALAAVANARRGQPARTSVPIGDSPQYREAVAEYYRRLGGS